MSGPIIRGTAALKLFKEERNYAEGKGWKTTRYWNTLSKESAYSIAPSLIAGGWTFDVTHDGPKFIVTASKQGTEDGSAEIPTIRWGYKYEFLNKSLYLLPEIMADIDQWVTGRGLKRSDYKKGIEDALSNGEDLSSDYSGLANTENLFIELCRGADSFETETVILYRETTTSPEYAAKLKLGGSRRIYETGQLLAANGPAFDCPPYIASVLPGQTGNLFPSETAKNIKWGWRQRVYDGEYEGDKFVQRSEWTAAAWSNWIYSAT